MQIEITTCHSRSCWAECRVPLSALEPESELALVRFSTRLDQLGFKHSTADLFAALDLQNTGRLYQEAQLAKERHEIHVVAQEWSRGQQHCAA